MEKRLGLAEGELGEKPALIVPNSIEFLKYPSGKELGANEKWGPGAFTSGGLPEVVVNQFAPGEYTVIENIF